MGCYVCGSEKYIDIFNKPEVRIWTNIGDTPYNRIGRYRCVLRQCTACGHVYQPIPGELNRILMDTYLSDNAQASTPTGVGNWGMQRARMFLDKIDIKNYTSAIEIGCADGYILRCLKEKGFKTLVGIEPSLPRTEEVDGILFLKEFANETLQLPRKYDFLYANSVFEHIEQINGAMAFCKNNISENGELFFTVPNALARIEDGDPGLFIHQHVHYYTEQAVRYLLAKHGFAVKSMRLTKDFFDVSAVPGVDTVGMSCDTVIYDYYEARLDKVLDKIAVVLQKDNTIIHGVNNALNNILSWLNCDFHFTLVDNDETKHGKRYFNTIVHSIDDIDIADYEQVLIVPVAYYEVVREAYIKKGFKGKFENVLLDEQYV